MVKVRGEEVLGFDDVGDDIALFKVGGKGDFVFDGDGGDDGEDIIKVIVSSSDFTPITVIPIV